MFHAQAAIAATHARALGEGFVRWPLILVMYDHLYEMNPSPVVALNRAVAISKVHGAEAGLASIEPLMGDSKLRSYYLLLAVQGHLLLDLGKCREAAVCFQTALQCRCSAPERRFLKSRLAACGVDIS